MFELWESLRATIALENPELLDSELDALADEALEEELEAQNARAGNRKSFRFDEV